MQSALTLIQKVQMLIIHPCHHNTWLVKIQEICYPYACSLYFRIIFKKFCLEILQLCLKTVNYACTIPPVHAAAHTFEEKKPRTINCCIC